MNLNKFAYSKESIQSCFDTITSFYKDYKFTLDSNKFIEYTVLLDLLQKLEFSHYVDLGVGYSVMPFLYSSLFKKSITAIDIDSKVIHFQKQLEINHLFPVQFHLIENSFPLTSNSVDFLSSISVLEHIPNHSRNNTLSEISRVVKKGGYFVFSVPFAYENFCKNIITKDFKFIEITFDHNLLNELLLSQLPSFSTEQVYYFKEHTENCKNHCQKGDNIFDYWKIVSSSPNFIDNSELQQLHWGMSKKFSAMPGVIMVVCKKNE